MTSFVCALTITLCQLATRQGVPQEVVSPAASRFAPFETGGTPDFQKHVVPLLGRLGCNSAKCPGSFQGQAGFRLSLSGFDFSADHAALNAEAITEEGQRLPVGSPGESLMLLKATGSKDEACYRLLPYLLRASSGTSKISSGIPESNSQGGRDHWDRAMCALIAGGDVRGGQEMGRTDSIASQPVGPVGTPDDQAASFHRNIGVDPRTEFQTNVGCPVTLVREGTPISALLGDLTAGKHAGQ